VALGDRLHYHKADVVAVADVVGTGIAEPDEEQHGSSPSAIMRGLTRAFTHSRKTTDCRVKPGNDDRIGARTNRGQ